MCPHQTSIRTWRFTAKVTWQNVCPDINLTWLSFVYCLGKQSIYRHHRSSSLKVKMYHCYVSVGLLSGVKNETALIQCRWSTHYKTHLHTFRTLILQNVTCKERWVLWFMTVIVRVLISFHRIKEKDMYEKGYAWFLKSSCCYVTSEPHIVRQHLLCWYWHGNNAAAAFEMQETISCRAAEIHWSPERTTRSRSYSCHTALSSTTHPSHIHHTEGMDRRLSSDSEFLRPTQ